VHVVGGLVGKFNMGQENSTRPAILLNGYKAFSGALTTDAATPAPATPLSTRSASSLAPPGYTKPVPTASWSPKTPSRSRNKQVLLAKNKTTRAKGVSGSEDESQQTPPDAFIFNDDSVDTPTTFYDAPSFEDGVLGVGSLEDDVDVVAKNTKLTSQKRRRVK
jgi:hypothetical protein